ncbi:flavodoxin domain-containing protein [Nocardia brasiliensis]|uniref:flavodoxin domain-containing protein n=1 Tax=Nocardia brasiliensis TaxID=37326 RepID=UPI0018952B94|nr:flavodoxin domain-containing protein [Nocardia brasiliensis]MBF6129859.1 flavodoxin domain-containing protein [Nocardia brasiliensis]MBF6542400.1 flavodoxin domain-containing protein [Nocardia brasiliensis]
MRSRVVYESMFGNTAAIAEAIAEGLGKFGTVEVINVSAAANVPAPTVDLLVVGAPTHAFGLSRRKTRLDAATHTEAPIVVEIGIREWLDAALGVPEGRRAAAFGTKVAKPPWLPGSAAHATGKRLRRIGYELADEPVDFFVDGMTGPLRAGEPDRARAWAERLAHTEHDRLAHHT